MARFPWREDPSRVAEALANVAVGSYRALTGSTAAELQIRRHRIHGGFHCLPDARSKTKKKLHPPVTLDVRPAALHAWVFDRIRAAAVVLAVPSQARGTTLDCLET